MHSTGVYNAITSIWVCVTCCWPSMSKIWNGSNSTVNTLPPIELKLWPSSAFWWFWFGWTFRWRFGISKEKKSFLKWRAISKSPLTFKVHRVWMNISKNNTHSSFNTFLNKSYASKIVAFNHCKYRLSTDRWSCECARLIIKLYIGFWIFELETNAHYS